MTKFPIQGSFIGSIDIIKKIETYLLSDKILVGCKRRSDHKGIAWNVNTFWYVLIKSTYPPVSIDTLKQFIDIDNTFKVGDYVVITKSDFNWSINMDKHVGKVVKLHIEKRENIFGIKEDCGFYSWAFTDGHFRKPTTEEMLTVQPLPDSIKPYIPDVTPISTLDRPIVKLKVIKDIRLRDKWRLLPDVIPSGTITWTTNPIDHLINCMEKNPMGTGIHIENNKYMANIPGEYFEIIEDKVIDMKVTDEWEPKVGEYVIMVNAGGWGYHPDNNGCLAVIDEVGKRKLGGSKTDTTTISGRVLNPKYNIGKWAYVTFDGVPIFNQDGDVLCRKALPQEITDSIIEPELIDLSSLDTLQPPITKCNDSSEIVIPEVKKVVAIISYSITPTLMDINIPLISVKPKQLERVVVEPFKINL